MTSKLEITQKKDDDPQSVLKTLTEIVNECIKCYEKGEKLNLTKVHYFLIHSSHLLD